MDNIMQHTNGHAREIIIQIASALDFKIYEDEKGVSAYGGNCIRISDHCTYMQTWVDNNIYNTPIEFVYKSSEMTPEKARMIAYDIREALKTSNYANNVRGEKRILNSLYLNMKF